MLTYEFLTAWAQARFNVEDDRGASLVEYALLVALIAVVCIAAVSLLGNSASTKFESIAGEINSGT
ncbi:MAG: Flp family type IVb pilin [Actinomycetia bacterium]|nr:Flp family type IVb pilin [Actinomycetes bacterium]